jgi:polar amino acid transport system substrate-binding protein
MDTVKREGLMATVEKVRSRLDNYKELGYSSAGIVLESSVPDIKPGDRVACAGATANHAEIVCVPRNLVALIPDAVAFDEAAFTTLGAIAMQGVRQADVRLGETVAVIGLGLLGIITIQLLKASGCRVIGLDVSDSNFELAKRMGCDECIISGFQAVGVIESCTNGYGADAIIITAGTKSNEPMELALQMGRKKSKVVVVGAIGMNVPRSPFYEKEIDIRISCSYGPGRYDVEYEEYGLDYPIAYVRWTENRNMQAVLQLMAEKRLDVKPLITHRISVPDGLRAYDLITGKIEEKYIGILIEYPAAPGGGSDILRKVALQGGMKSGGKGIGFIGAGNFAQSMLLPPLQSLGVSLRGVSTADPVNAKSVARKFNFGFAATDAKEILQDKDIDAVFVATRHDSHARYVVDALNAGKHVFVEKPLAINFEQLCEIKRAMENHPGLVLTVGLNRRFSESFGTIKRFFEPVREPLVVQYRVHAGFIPKNHWVQDPSQGGRIIGEGCHFIDVMQFLTGARPVKVYADAIRSANSKVNDADNCSITISFSDGSLGILQYLANGDSSVPKEYCEVYGGGRTAIMNNFKSVEMFNGGKQIRKTFDGKKGHTEEVHHFIEAVSGKVPHVLTFESLYATTLVTIRAVESLASGNALTLE